MESSAALYVVRPRNSRQRRHSLVPVIVFAAMAIAGALAPPVLLAAETPVETQRNGIVVFIMIVLLFGSVAAGLVFASPLRRRLIRSAGGQNGAGEAAYMNDSVAGRSPVDRHTWPAPGHAADEGVTRPVQARAQPTYQGEGQEFDGHTVRYDPNTRYVPPVQPAYVPPVQPQYAPPAQPQHAPPQPQWGAPTQQPQPQYAPPAQPQHTAPQPQYNPPPAQHAPPAATPQAPRPATPWSTGVPTADSNWDPTRQHRPN